MRDEDNLQEKIEIIKQCIFEIRDILDELCPEKQTESIQYSYKRLDKFIKHL